jgi:hypothetical protein
VTAPPEACPSCGAPTEPLQDYCLDCGRRLVPERRVSSFGRAWEQRFGRYPGDWVWAALLLLLVAAGSATAGIVASNGDGGRTGETIVATSPVVTAPPAPPVATTTKEGATTGTTTTESAPPTTPTSALAVWPNRDGFTVVLASIPSRGTGLEDARKKATDARNRNVRNVGILTSSKFASLHPGYYVVFAGVYDSLDEAQTAASRLTGRYPNAYAREIAR